MYDAQCGSRSKSAEKVQTVSKSYSRAARRSARSIPQLVIPEPPSAGAHGAAASMLEWDRGADDCTDLMRGAASGRTVHGGPVQSWIQGIRWRRRPDNVIPGRTVRLSLLVQPQGSRQTRIGRPYFQDRCEIETSCR